MVFSLSLKFMLRLPRPQISLTLSFQFNPLLTTCFASTLVRFLILHSSIFRLKFLLLRQYIVLSTIFYFSQIMFANCSTMFRSSYACNRYTIGSDSQYSLLLLNSLVDLSLLYIRFLNTHSFQCSLLLLSVCTLLFQVLINPHTVSHFSLTNSF